MTIEQYEHEKNARIDKLPTWHAERIARDMRRAGYSVPFADR